MSQSTTTPCDTAGAVGLVGRACAVAGKVRALLLGGGDRATDRRNALVAFSVRIASAAILFLSQVALARWMGADQFGIYVYAWTLVLVLGVGDPTQRTPEVDAGAPGLDRPERARDQTRIGKGEQASGQTELAESIQLASGLRVHEGERVEVVDLGGDLRAERARVEPVDPPDG